MRPLGQISTARRSRWRWWKRVGDERGELASDRGIERSAEQTGFSCMSTSQPRWEASRLEEVRR